VAVDDVGSALSYNGRSWSSPKLADPAGAANGMVSVSCASSTFCVAVDFSGNAVTYDGKSWSSGDHIVSLGSFLAAVSCPTSTFCIAVGGQFAETWNGTSWSSPVRIDPGEDLASISCSSPMFCEAVDYFGDALTYNGLSWSPADNIDPGGGPNGPTSLSCPTAKFCEAVDGAGNALTFDGSSWSLPDKIDSRTTPTTLVSAILASVSCPTTTFCNAVDYAGDIVSYNGRSWAGPMHIDGNGSLLSVSCATSDLCEAVDNAGSVVAYSYNSAPIAAPGGVAGLSSAAQQAFRSGRIPGAGAVSDAQVTCAPSDASLVAGSFIGCVVSSATVGGADLLLQVDSAGGKTFSPLDIGAPLSCVGLSAAERAALTAIHGGCSPTP
jgi:hypothetical protein